MRRMDGGGRGPDQRSAVDLVGLLDDLRAESDELDAVVAGLDPGDWRRETPAPGWTVAHQISHLAWTDEKSLLAATDERSFQAEVDKALSNPTGFVDDGAEHGAGQDPAALLARWRAGRTALASALAEVPAGTKLPWFGPPMGVASMVTARLMETWAHGQDVADAFGVARQAGTRLRHIARLGVRTRDFAYAASGLEPPTAAIRVDLVAPDGETWRWGPDDARQRVAGPALDFCLVVTQRRHPDDTAVATVGHDAQQWMRVAQAFAGPPGLGRAAGQFTGGRFG